MGDKKMKMWKVVGLVVFILLFVRFLVPLMKIMDKQTTVPKQESFQSRIMHFGERKFYVIDLEARSVKEIKEIYLVEKKETFEEFSHPIKRTTRMLEPPFFNIRTSEMPLNYIELGNVTIKWPKKNNAETKYYEPEEIEAIFER